jgi:hypothetical protein
MADVRFRYVALMRCSMQFLSTLPAQDVAVVESIALTNVRNKSSTSTAGEPGGTQGSTPTVEESRV